MEKNYIDRFIKEVARNLEQTSCQSYESDIKLFLNDMLRKKNINTYNEIELLQSIHNDDVEDWIQDKVSADCPDTSQYALTTMNRKIMSLRKFFNYLKENKNIIEKNPFNNVDIFDPSKITTKQKDILTIEEIREVIHHTYIKHSTDRSFEFNSARIRFIIALMCTTGLRISEVLSICMDDIEKIDNGYMINISKEKVKNDIDKRVPITGLVINYFNEYLSERNKLNNIIDTDILILSSRGKAISRKITERDIKKYVDRAGINKDINNHSCRHIFRTMLTKNNVNESLICIIGGWSRKSLSMSYIYTHDTKDLDNEKLIVCNIL